MKIFITRLDKTQLNDEEYSAIQTRIRTQRASGDFLCLDFEARKRSRLAAVTEQGVKVAIDLPRTDTIKDGSVLATSEGEIIEVIAKPQQLTEVRADTLFALMRGAYHLGNRHVPLMLSKDCLYFEPDYVLEAMLHSMGLQTAPVQMGFEPEIGAYQSAHAHHHHKDNNFVFIKS